MVVTNEKLLINEGTQAQTGLLVDRVERDMAGVLNEHGSTRSEDKREARVFSFGYGIPMAGVRYYSFTEDQR